MNNYQIQTPSVSSQYGPYASGYSAPPVNPVPVNSVAQQYGNVTGLGMNFSPTETAIGNYVEPLFAKLDEYGRPLMNKVGDMVQPGVDAYQGASTLGKVTGGLQAAQGVFNAYNAYKTNKLGKEQLNFKKMEANRNYESQKRLTNSQLADRQAARVARNPNQHASVSDYMNKYGVK